MIIYLVGKTKISIKIDGDVEDCIDDCISQALDFKARTKCDNKLWKQFQDDCKALCESHFGGGGGGGGGGGTPNPIPAPTPLRLDPPTRRAA